MAICDKDKASNVTKTQVFVRNQIRIQPFFDWQAILYIYIYIYKCSNFQRLLAYHTERSGIPLQDAVEVNCKKVPHVMAQVPSTCAKGSMLSNCACVI